MSLLTFLLGLAAGAWAESNFDLTGRALHLWRRWQAWRKGK